jgi:Ketopantoate hydroxymethyltransferase
MASDEPVTIPALQKMKQEGKKSAGFVLWDYQTALIAERAGADFVVIGDSVGVNLLGQTARWKSRSTTSWSSARRCAARSSARS